MPESADNSAESATPEVGLESGTYEIIRKRLLNCGRQLRSRLKQLNEARKEVFGSIDTALLSTERITTDHNCVARDMVSIGGRFLFGYNVHFGLKSETQLSDVFAVYRLTEQTLHPDDLSLLNDSEFARDFRELLRYYRDAVFAKFAVRGPLLYIVFRVGKTVGEVKVFKWQIESPDSDSATLRYINNRSEHEYRFPPQHEFDWLRCTRDHHHYGDHPHISIQDRVFVETVGGDLTIKVENNTATGEGIYSEPVDDPDQTLDDAEIYYAVVGHIILLRVRPYQETEFRHIVYNEKLQQAMRVDSIRDACVLLPDDHGLIFPGGFYLQNGEYKTFEHGLEAMLYERTIAAPNGEDYLFVFYNRKSGTYVLLQYNLIEQKVSTPLICNGWTFFEAGELLCFKSQGEAQKHHAIQLWQTPYVGEDYVPQTQSNSFLNKVGNKDIVRGTAECHEVLNLIDKEDTYANLYTDLARQSGEIIDSYFWLDREDTFNLAESLAEIRASAMAAVDEFEKVVRVKSNTTEQTQAARVDTERILSQIRQRRFEHINDFVTSLAELRVVRGRIISLRDLRYADQPLIDQLEASVAEQAERLSHSCVEFLLQPSSLLPYEEKIRHKQSGIEHLTKVTDAKSLEDEISASASELEMLIEIVSNLQIDDATQRTTIIDSISDIFSTVNQARAILRKKLKELASVEGVAEFNSQIKLLNQAVVNYLDICDTPEKCEDYVTKMMIQLEDLEGRFAEFDEFIVQLTEKREEIYSAFENRRLQLVEARNRRADSLVSAAERVLKGIQTRLRSFDSVSDINGYFAADLMIEKVRDIVAQLQELDDSVKVDDIQGRLKTIREDAVRQLRDRQELFVGGDNTIRLGAHLFSVNTQSLDLTTVPRDGCLSLHLTGTNFFEPVSDERLTATRDVWNQEVVSENKDVYRGEYLAWKILQAATEGQEGIPDVRELAALSDEDLLAFVQRFMGPRFDEAYTRGIHDVDATKMVRSLVKMRETIGLLRYDSPARALALRYWHVFANRKTKTDVAARMSGAGAVASAFQDAAERDAYVTQLQDLVGTFVADSNGFPRAQTEDSTGSQRQAGADAATRGTTRLCRIAAEYLYFELSGDAAFAYSRVAAELARDFHQYLKANGFSDAFEKSVSVVSKDKVASLALLKNWVQAFLSTRNPNESKSRRDVNDNGHQPSASSVRSDGMMDYADEVALILRLGQPDDSQVIDVAVDEQLTGIVGAHSVVDGGHYHLNYNRFVRRLTAFETTVVPQFNAWTECRHDIVQRARQDMRLEEFQPRVLTSFVRNRLLNDVYLPLIGDNLAKQTGAVGEGKRTDLMGLLLLVSPPGYGKTTLMEYIANRLGLIFMKINGPALGHSVTSLDPVEATNASAREEVEKLNLALEMGDNVMIYVDDIQHTNPEFLQKFISLCDAQRKIEGVYKGRARTYDLRGRKVAVVMAGNPYTESGELFRIPDMLSNRADIYNLGEIIGEARDAFEMSYLENALTSNPVLAKLSVRSQKDVYAVIRMAGDEPRDEIELEGNYSLEELNELVSTMRKLMRVRDVILTVNQEYIRSAAQSDDYRTEPAFKLQGSYRNMNRIAEKVLPIMNDDELTALIVSNYENDAQTLTSGTEANLLKFRELVDLLSDEDTERWNDIKLTFRQNVRMRGLSSDDGTGQVIATLGNLSDGLYEIQKALMGGLTALTERRTEERPAEPEQPAPALELLQDDLQGLRDGLDEINRSIIAGMSQLAVAGQPASEPVPAPAMETPTPERSVTRERVAADVDSGRITIVNKIPQTVVAVLKQQFRLMNRWLEPLHQASQSQQADMSALRGQIDKCLELYEQLIERIDAGFKS